jgi:hypothetical protein
MTTDKIAQLVISAIVVIGFGLVIVGWLVWPPQSQGNSNLLSGLTGALCAGYVQVVNYWFRNPT